MEMRAEEMEFSVPDARSVRALNNATPILSEDGDVVSVVAMVQDLGPLEEIERQRAAFLGTVSHELRAPLTSTNRVSSWLRRYHGATHGSVDSSRGNADRGTSDGTSCRHSTAGTRGQR